MRKNRRLLDELSHLELPDEPHPRPQPGNGEHSQRGPRGSEIETDVPDMWVVRLGRKRYHVQWSGQSYDVRRGRVETRSGGRYRRQLIRWLIGYVDDLLYVFFLGFARERIGDLEIGLHLWLDHFIRRMGSSFLVEWFKLLDLKLAKA